MVVVLALPFATAARAPVNGTEQTKTVAEIFTDARHAMSNASSFHVLGRVQAQGTEAFNLSLSKTGGGGSVTVLGATMEIVVAKGTLYIKANQKSWLVLTKSKSTAQLVANRWIKIKATNSSFSDFASLTITKDFVSQFLGGGSSGLTKVPGTTNWDGHLAVVLTNSSGDKLYIADTGVPYILRVQGSGKSGSLNFSDFNSAPMPPVPTNAISLPGA